MITMSPIGNRFSRLRDQQQIQCRHMKQYHHVFLASLFFYFRTFALFLFSFLPLEKQLMTSDMV